MGIPPRIGDFIKRLTICRPGIVALLPWHGAPWAFSRLEAESSGGWSLLEQTTMKFIFERIISCLSECAFSLQSFFFPSELFLVCTFYLGVVED